MIQKVYMIENLDCANCAAKIEAKINALPEVKDASITFADSFGECFYVFVDGTYLLIEDGCTTLYGEALLLRDGCMTQISESGDIVILEN